MLYCNVESHVFYGTAEHGRRVMDLVGGTQTPSTASYRSTSPTISERRLSIRQSESINKYKDILVKKTLNFTQVILNATVGNQKNVLTLKVAIDWSFVN